MNPAMFEEADGLTMKMVGAYLKRKGFTRRGEEWFSPDGEFTTEGNTGTSVERIAQAEDRSVQALLRDLNPRLRPLPSSAARAAHRGKWIAIDEQGHGYIVKFNERDEDVGFEVYRSSGSGDANDLWSKPGCSYNVSNFQNGLKGWRFWPSDDAGNKMPWPKNADGDPL